MIASPPAAPLARRAMVSLVLVSPSMEMALKERETAWVRRAFRAEGLMGTSVQRMPRRVAMFGWIMPAPLVMPAKQYWRFGEEGRVKVRDRSLGKVSVVQIARAVASQVECVEARFEWAVGMASRIFLIGRLGS